MIRTIALASLTALAATTAATAQDGTFTLGAGYERADFDGVDIDAITLRGGYDFTERFGVEAQLGFGLSDESYTQGGVTADVELNYSAGVFGVFNAYSTENTSVFLRAGYTVTEIEASAGSFSLTGDDNAWAYGAGGEYFFDGRNGVRVDYTRFDFEDGGDADVFGISYVRRFGL